MRRFVRCLIAVSLALALGGRAEAQSRVTGADVEGVVRDQTEAIVQGATVTVTNLETQVSRQALTDADGRFFVAAVPPGRYRLTASLVGFASQTVEGVPVLLGQSVERELVLSVAAGQESVTIADEAPLVDARRTAVTFVVGQRQIDALPINGRNFVGFAAITPGVTTDRTASQGVISTSGLSFTGQSARSNNIMVDGLDNNDDTSGGVRGLFSQEAVREFQVLTDSYSAEFGKAVGGVVNIVTKSGTSQLHGSAFAFVRNERLNARDYFEKYDVFGDQIDHAKAPFRQEQWGATLGGPLRKDRSFFFLSFERSDGQGSNFVSIDPAAAAALGAAGFPVETGNVPYPFAGTQVLAKIDHQWNQDHSIVVRGNYATVQDGNSEPYGGLVAKSAGAALDRRDWFVSASETDILSPNWVHELRVLFSRQRQTVRSNDPRCDGACDGDFEGGPMLILPGIAIVGRNFTTPLPRTTELVQVADTISFYKGRHLVKAGVDFTRTDNTVAALPYFFGGMYVFSPLPGAALLAAGLPPQAAPLSTLDALRLGLPVAYIQGYGDPNAPNRYSALSAFLQDEWRVTSRLTLKPGIRLQRQFFPSREFDVSDVGGTRFRYPFPGGRTNVAPRLGIAFTPWGGGTALRAAWGRFYDDQITGPLGTADVVDGTTRVRSNTVVFPTTVAAWRAPGHRLPEPQGPYATPVVSLDPSLRAPYADQISLGVDQSLGRDLSLSVSLLQVRGHHQMGTLDYNPLLPALGPGRRPNDVDGRPGTSAQVLQYTTFAQSWYRGVAVALQKRFDGRMEFLASYTLSKAEDNSTDFFIGVQDSGRGRNPADPTGLPLGFDPSSQRGLSGNDQRHRLVLSGLYQLPGQFRVATIITAGSGRPFTPLAGVDLNRDGDPLTDRARRNIADPSSAVGRNSETTGAQLNVDLRLSRLFKLKGDLAAEAIIEAFNLLDRANFTEVDRFFGAGAFPGEPLRDAQGRVTYGRPTGVLPPRQVQLALKVSF